ncbi:hypothetical protein DL98DRAFT_436263, partial [Cadophora sp. DSE1049]
VEQIITLVVFIYSKNVLHGDIFYNNVLFNKSFNAKLGDFARFLINRQDSLICYKTSYEHPKIISISIGSKLFAFSSTFYKIITRSKLYKKLLNTKIIRVYKKGKYPNLVFLAAFNNTIHKC